MSTVLLQAFTWDLMCLHCSAALIKAVWVAIQDRHRQYRLTPPIEGPRAFARMLRSIEVVQGTPRKLLMPISKEHIKALLLLEPRGATWREQLLCLQDKLITVTGVLSCSRPSELAQMQCCDFLPDFDVRAYGQKYAGTAALVTCQRKQDQTRRGHMPRFGKSANAKLDIVHQLKHLLARCGRVCDPACTKSLQRTNRCPVCPPLFGRVKMVGSTLRVSNEDTTRQQISDAVKRALGYIGVDSRLFSGVSMRKGGLSTAIAGGVSEPVLWLQSGHGQLRAARTYVHLADTAHLFSTWAAFDL